VWLIGDCQALIDGHPFENRKTIDDVLSDIRSLVLELKLLQGVSFEQLHREDPGRQFIQPLLKMQHLLQNNSGSMFGYPVLDGTSLSGNGIQVRQVASGETQIVLASDGYPVLKPTLADSESYLTTILAEDPLLFRAFRSTKGLSPGNQSFDDRAYIRFRIEARG
jgi:glycerophosphoryl diester phosphodiesterase